MHRISKHFLELFLHSFVTSFLNKMTHLNMEVPNIAEREKETGGFERVKTAHTTSINPRL